jgi:hypothetical protein
MMKKSFITNKYIYVLITVFILISGNEYAASHQNEYGFTRSTGEYLGQKPPGATPEIFAPGIVTYSSFNHASPAISTNCKEIYWPSKDREAILVSKLNNGKWSDPEVLSVLNGFKADCPVISTDGQYLFFLRLSQGGSEIYWIHTKHIETLAIE